MKKLICLIMIAVLTLSLASCINIKKRPDGSTKTDTKGTYEESDIDVDLSAMSSTMVYSEVQNMTQTPDEYMGKVVRMTGNFSVAEVNNNRYFACIIQDATACCAQGIEFVWAGDHSYPDDYPDPDTEITVTGIFTSYKEGQNTYYQLKDAALEF